MSNVFSKIFDFIKGLVTRAGLSDFLKKYQALAIQVITELATVNSGQGFHEWRDDAYAKFAALLKADKVEIKGTWITIILNLAYEVFLGEKEKGSN